MKLGAWFCMLCAALPWGAGRADVMASTSYVVKAGSPASGGGSLSGPTFALGALSGQPLVIGPATSSGVAALGGFYYILRGQRELLDKRNTCLVLNGAMLLACFDGAGIWRSGDGGAHWTAATTQPADPHVRAVVVHPSASSTLYAISHGGGVHVSHDNGAQWAACANTGLDLRGTALAIAADGRLYAGTAGGIHASADCANWTALNTGLTVDAQKPPLAILVDPTASAKLLAGFDGLGVFLSGDAGAHWTAAASQPTGLGIRALLRTAAGDAHYAASHGNGIFKSVDGGAHWTACPTQPTNPGLLSLAADAQGRLYAGGAAGVSVSTDACASWTTIDTGLP